MPFQDLEAHLLTLGVSHGSHANVQPFDLGGAGQIDNEQPFDVEAPYVGVFNVQLFDVEGGIGTTNLQPFDLGEVAYIANEQPFAIIGAALPVPGTNLPPPVLSAVTTLTAPTSIGAQTITVASVAGIAVGTVIYLGSSSYLVTDINGLVVTLATTLSEALPIGASVYVSTTAITLTAPAAAGATTVTVASTAGLTIGMTIGIYSATGSVEYRVITALTATTITFSVPLGSSYPIGSGVAQAPSFLTGMSIFSKAGAYIGQLRDYTINSPRSYSIREPGSMTFYTPRNSPDIPLIQSDRLVAVTNNVGLPVWAGTITTQEWSEGVGNIHCEDIFALLSGVPIDIELETADDTPASAVYGAVLALVNARRGADSEILWQSDLQGSAIFMGDFIFEGDPLDAFEEIADRSGTEYAWRAEIVGNQLVITLVVRDSFSAGAGVDFVDGDGGNVAASPSYQVDPTTIINGLRLTGETTDIARYTPDWAEWAVHEIEPSVEVYADTGDFRRRIDLNINVDWSLSKREQRRLANLTKEDVWDLYEKYLYAMHDVQGRPNHDGWVYEGPTEEIEPGLTKDKWHTHLEISAYKESRPASIVMKSESLQSWLIVQFNMTFSRKDVKIIGFNDLGAIGYMDTTVAPGTYTIYEESGGRARVYDTFTTATSVQWVLNTSSITARLPNGSRISLRAIFSPAEYKGRYVNLSEGGFTMVHRPPGPIVITQGDQIGKVWRFEKPQIRNFDPRRDGTGAYISRPTIFNGQLTTKYRWHIVSYSVGEFVETQLAEGLFVTDVTGPAGTNRSDTVFVESAAGFPIDQTPFDILVGDVIDPTDRQEIMTVYQTFGNRWTVWRGVQAATILTTSAINIGQVTVTVTDGSQFLSSQVVIIGTESVVIESVDGNTLAFSEPVTENHPIGSSITTAGLIQNHPAGTSVRLLGGGNFDGFEYPYTWPEGDLYARNLLERLRYPTKLVSLNITNENDDWSSVQLGSLHTVDVATEGPPGGVVAVVRVIGMSPDEDSGSMEVVVEVQ